MVLSKYMFQNDEFCVLRLWIFYHQCLLFHLILPQKKYMQGVFFCSILLLFQVGYLFFSFLNLLPISISHCDSSSFTFLSCFVPSLIFYCEVHIDSILVTEVYNSVAFRKFTKLCNLQHFLAPEYFYYLKRKS